MPSSWQLHAARCSALLQHLYERSSLFRRQLAQRLLRSLSILIGRHGVGHFTIPLQNLLIGVALGRVSLFVALNKIPVLFLELFITEQVVKDTHGTPPFTQQAW